MNKSKSFSMHKSFIFRNTFEGDAPPASDAPPAAPDQVSISKADLAKYMAQNDNAKNLMKEVELLRTQGNMTKEERTEQDNRLKELENKLLTESELAKREKNKLEKARKESETTLSSERDHWKGLYNNERIVRSIQDAAIEQEAINPEQMIALLQGSTKLVEVRSDTGETSYNTITSIPSTGEDGKPFVAELPVSKAIAHMKEQPHNFNLFKSALKDGFNGSNRRGAGGDVSEAEIAKDPAKWKEHSRAKRGQK